MRGDEQGLGSPHRKDYLSLKCTQTLFAIRSRPNCSRDCSRCHLWKSKDRILPQDIERRTAEAKSSWLWEKQDPRIQRYMSVSEACFPERSNIHSLIRASVQGRRGFHTPPSLFAEKGYENQVYLSEKVCTVYEFDLMDVVRENLILDGVDYSFDLLQFDDWIDEKNCQLYTFHQMHPRNVSSSF